MACCAAGQVLIPADSSEFVWLRLGPAVAVISLLRRVSGPGILSAPHSILWNETLATDLPVLDNDTQDGSASNLGIPAQAAAMSTPR